MNQNDIAVRRCQGSSKSVKQTVGRPGGYVMGWYPHVCIRACIKRTFLHIGKLFSPGRGSFLALSVAGHADDPHVYYGACLGPGRVLRCVLWASKVARADRFSREHVPQSRAKQGNGNPTIQLFALLLVPYMYRTVPQALKHSNLWQQRYQSSRTSNVTATDDSSVCAYAMFPVVLSLGNRNQCMCSQKRCN